jgi:hypothetical protein
MRISRWIRPKLPASAASKLIYSPLEGTMKQLYEVSTEITAQFTTSLRTVVCPIFSNLATEQVSAPPHMKTKTHPVSKTLCFLFI